MDTVTTAPAPTAAAAPGHETTPGLAGGRRWRGVLAGITGTIAVAMLTFAAIGIWANDEVFDSNEVGQLAAVALADSEVQSGLASWATARVFGLIDVEAAIEALLPTDDQALAPFVAAGARSIVEQQLTLELAEPDLQRLLVDGVEGAHDLLMDILASGGLTGSLSIHDGRVTLNVVPLIARGLFALSEIGLIDAEIPRTLSADDRPGQIAELEAATGRALPDDFGELVVYQSDDLADAELTLQSAQRAVTFAHHFTVALAVASVLLLVATVVIARRRWGATLWLGLGGLIAMVLARLFVDRVVDDAPNLVGDIAGQAAVAGMLGEASDGLHRITAIVAFGAVLAIVWALMATGWRRPDLFVIGGAVLGLVAVGALGFSVGSLVLGAALGVLAVTVGRFLQARSGLPAQEA